MILGLFQCPGLRQWPGHVLALRHSLQCSIISCIGWCLSLSPMHALLLFCRCRQAVRSGADDLGGRACSLMAATMTQQGHQWVANLHKLWALHRGHDCVVSSPDMPPTLDTGPRYAPSSRSEPWLVWQTLVAVSYRIVLSLACSESCSNARHTGMPGAVMLPDVSAS